MTASEITIRYFAGTELGVACLLRRYFSWMEGALWFDEIPDATDARKTVFMLSGDDTILNVEVSIDFTYLYAEDDLNLQYSERATISGPMVLRKACGVRRQRNMASHL